MITCPFCQFENEDGALFCEQCKSDLSSMQPTPVAEAIPMTETEPEGGYAMAEIADEAPMAMAAESAEPLLAEAVPVAEAEPAKAEPVIVGAVPEPAPAAFFESPTPAAVPTPATPAATPPAPAVPAPAAPAAAEALPAGAQPRLVVLRGLKLNVEYPLYEGHNFIGRSDEKPVDVDLEDQEPPDRIWSSRQHALITYEDGRLAIEDLNSSNGTFVNRTRIYPGTKKPLNVNDVVQVGTVQMKVKV